MKSLIEQEEFNQGRDTVQARISGPIRKQRNSRMYMHLAEEVALVKEINTTALFQLRFYLTKINTKDYVITDEKTAKAIGLTLRTVRLNRGKLIKHNWFHTVKTSNRKENVVNYIYYFLKESVYELKYFGRLFSGCNTVKQVLRKFDRKRILEILDNTDLSIMEQTDIKNLLNIPCVSDG